MHTDENKVLYHIGLAILILTVLIVSLIYIFPINYQRLLPPCLFLKLTGIYCPGCGGTRSVQALLHGSILSSLRYNPIVFYGFIVYFWFMLSNTIETLSKHKIKIGMKYRDIYFWIGLGIVLVYCVFRNILLVVYKIDLNYI